jgi:broad specificity phosphatase PhoE
LLFTRHGEADWNASSRWQGQADRPLTGKEREQASGLAEQIRDTPIGAAYSSDLSRAYETAVIALEGRELRVRRCPGLRERSFGSWDGLLDDEIPRRFPLDYAAWRRSHLQREHLGPGRAGNDRQAFLVAHLA